MRVHENTARRTVRVKKTSGCGAGEIFYEKQQSERPEQAGARSPQDFWSTQREKEGLTGAAQASVGQTTPK